MKNNSKDSASRCGEGTIRSSPSSAGSQTRVYMPGRTRGTKIDAKRDLYNLCDEQEESRTEPQQFPPKRTISQNSQTSCTSAKGDTPRGRRSNGTQVAIPKLKKDFQMYLINKLLKCIHLRERISYGSQPNSSYTMSLII